VAELEKGVRPWLKPWNAEHAAGRITRPLRATANPIRSSMSLPLHIGFGRRPAVQTRVEVDKSQILATSGVNLS
jgi:hypothetical protein